MTLKSQVLVQVGIPMALGLVALVAVTLSLQFNEYPAWTKGTGEASQQAELETLERLRDEKEGLLAKLFGQVMADTYAQARSLEAAWNGDVPFDVLPAYWGLSALGHTPSGYVSGQVLDGSYLYHPEVRTPGQLTARTDIVADVDRTSVEDVLYRAMFVANPQFDSLYLGLESGLLRVFPYQNADHLPTLEYHSFCTNAPTVGYDPRCRGWYRNSIASIPPGSDAVFLSEPYMDASGGALVISAAKPVYEADGVTRFGVAASDIDITIAREAVLGQPVGENGYGLVLSRDTGALLMHPDLDVESGEVRTLTEFELKDDAEAAALINADIAADRKGMREFRKSGTRMYAAYGRIPNTPMVVMLVVPHSDVVAPARKAERSVEQVLHAQVGVFVPLLLFVCGALAYLASRATNEVVRPLLTLTRMSRLVERGNYQVALSTMDTNASNADVREISDKFSGMLRILRAGNVHFATGRFDAALSTYREALELCVSLRSPNGRAVCLNNIGNVLRQMGKFAESRAALEESLDVATRVMSAKSAEDQAHPMSTRDWLRVGLRHGNLAKLAADEGNAAESVQHWGEARKIFARDNVRSLAHYANATLAMTRTAMAHARAHADQALLIDPSAVLREFATVVETVAANAPPPPAELSGARAMGALMRAEVAAAAADGVRIVRSEGGDTEEEGEEGEAQTAEWWLRQAVEMGDVVYVHQQRRFCKELADAWDDAEQAQSLLRIMERSHMENSDAKPRNMVFVVDCSGSMTGERIRSAKENMIKLVERVVSPVDHLGIILFSSKVRVFEDLRVMGQRQAEIAQRIRDIPPPEGKTALWEALARAVLMTEESLRPTTILLLTDGDDTTDFSYSEVQQMLEESEATLYGISLYLNNEATVEKLQTLCDRTSDGLLLQVRKEGGVQSLDVAMERVIANMHSGTGDQEVLV